jgi:hypothetical protein
MSQPGLKLGLIAGALLSPLLYKLVTPVLSWLTKWLLAATAQITPKIGAATKAACLWALSFSWVRSIITTNPKACETLVDTAVNCLTAIILVVQTTVDEEIEEAGMKKAPDPVPSVAPAPAIPADAAVPATPAVPPAGGPKA